MKKSFFCFISLSIVLSCTKNNDVLETGMIPIAQESNFVEGISRDVIEITADDAIKVAKILDSSGKTKSTINRNVKDVKAIYSQDGAINMYAVGYENSNGFTLISATKKYYPILADVDNGCFDEGIYETGVSVLLDEYNQSISYCRTLSEDSLERFRSLWREYEQKEIPVCKLTKDGSSISSLISASFSEWQNQGYEIYDLGGGAPEDLPQSVYDNWYSIAESLANENYSIDDNAFILRRRYYVTGTIGSILQTHWGQDNNCGRTILANGYNKVGCATIAVGQLLKYHEYPSSYNWADMPFVMYSHHSNTLPNFLYDVAIAIGIDSDGSTNINSICTGLPSFGYQFSNNGNHTESSTRSSILQGSPVLMTGINSDNEGHAWVCDAYQENNLYQEYILEILSCEEPLQFVSPVQPYNMYVSGPYYSYHMNWGWGTYGMNNFDGWYSDASSSFSWPVNYTINRQDICNLSPSN